MDGDAYVISTSGDASQADIGGIDELVYLNMGLWQVSPRNGKVLAQKRTYLAQKRILAALVCNCVRSKFCNDCLTWPFVKWAAPEPHISGDKVVSSGLPAPISALADLTYLG